MKLFKYNINGFEEIPFDEKGNFPNIELINSEMPINEKYKLYEGDVFPPPEMKLVNGELVYKTEKERVESGEIPLSVIKERVIESINLHCEQDIILGFESDALGEIHIYDSEDTDQTNLIGSVVVGITIPYRCKNKATGVKEWILHSNSEIQKVLYDGALRKNVLLQNCSVLKDAVIAATDYDTVVSFEV